jgi:arsenate reductase-like glutaredoxin family protein
MNPEVLVYLKATRNWFREHRLASAQFNLRMAPPDKKQFWLDILAALGADRPIDPLAKSRAESIRKYGAD